MKKSMFAVFALLVTAGLASGVHSVAARGADGAPAAVVAGNTGSASAVDAPLGDSGWS
ncbi:hypothetical protein [Streptomyces cyaneochromogenes]|uniref:hypothetical protein n=1 Tax=Streptomyces cyaneochromogenes TaxID=2496836 RepID=UPI00158CBBF0|nr:hypothetical protein [Streptomyces cyaneochromogenes]